MQLCTLFLPVLILYVATVVCGEPTPSFEVELSISSTADNRMKASVAFTNTLPEPQMVMVWGTPFDNIEAGRSFSVSLDGVALPYMGIRVRRNPAYADYIRFEARERLAVEVELSGVYDVSKAGEYVVQMEGYLQALVNEEARSEAASNGIFVTSNSFSIRLAASEQHAHLVREPAETMAHTFTGCTTAHQNAINTAWPRFNYYCSRMQTNLGNSQVRPTAKYTTWFGAHTATRYNKALSTVNNMMAKSQGSGFKWVCNDPYCTQDPSVLAFVYTGDDTRVYMCPAALSLPIDGPYSVTDTIVHEVSHFNTVGGTYDHAYDITPCKNLAINSPGKAVANADNYAFYSDDVTGYL